MFDLYFNGVFVKEIITNIPDKNTIGCCIVTQTLSTGNDWVGGNLDVLCINRNYFAKCWVRTNDATQYDSLIVLQ